MGITTAIVSAAAATYVPAIVSGAALSGLFTGFLVRAAIGLALNALSPKPKQPGANRGYSVNSRGSALDHQIIYGKAKVGAAIVFDGTTGSNNKFLHRVLAFSGHEVESFDEIYINDAKVTNLESDGNVKEIELPDGTTSNRYDGFIRINKHLGTSNQAADSDLVNEVDDWTTNHRLRGIAYLYCRFKFDADKFPNGVPTVTATIKGKKLYDPRSDTTAWSDNPALCLRDYLTNGYGLNEDSSNIDDALVSSAANVCDETDTVAGDTRYTCNGAFTTAQTPYDTINNLITSMGGLVWYAQGKWRMKPAYWVAPAITFTEDDLRSSIAVKTRHSRRDNFNTVRGTFRGEETNWQTTDYPEVTNSAFLSADNGQESVADIDLPFTDSSTEARRIARIALERNRQQLTVSASFGLRAFQVQVGDVVNLSVDRFGWTQKEFEVVSWTFGLTDGLDLQVQMSLREISESVFDEVDDGIVYERDNTNLLSPFEVPNVGLSISSRLAIFKEKLVNKVTIIPTSGNAEAIDQVEVEYKPSNESDWITVGFGELGKFILQDIEDGDYDFRARSINTFGVKGDYNTRLSVPISGQSDPPQDVSGLNAELNGGAVFLQWEPVPDLDLSYYRIRHSLEETGAAYANATTAVDKVPRPANSISVSARPGTYHIKAIDKSGTGSENYTSIVVPEANLEDFTNNLTQTEETTFSGTKTDCSVVSNELVITDTSTAPSEATYDFSDYIDTGSVRKVHARVDVNVRRDDSSAGLWDDLPGNFDDLPGLFDSFTGAAQFADTNVVTYISTTDDDPAGTPTWSSYKEFRAGDFSGRAFRFRVVLKSTSDSVGPAISGLTARVQYN